MRIVHIEDYFDPDAGYQINDLLYKSTQAGIESIVITSTDMSPFHKVWDKANDKIYEKNTGVRIIRLMPLLKVSTRLLLKGMWRTVDEISPDLLFMHGIGDFKDLVLWRRTKSYIIVRDCHMSWVASHNKFGKLFYYAYSILFAPLINNSHKYDVVFALGIEEKQYLRRLGIRLEKIVMMPHGYNHDIMYFDCKGRYRVRELFGIQACDIAIGYIGKFDEHKQPHLVLNILNKLGADYIDEMHIKVIMIGPKDELYMKYFDVELSKFCRKTVVHIDNSKPFGELKDYFSALDICLFPRETTLSSLHAQVCGCRVIMERHQSNIERVVDQSMLYTPGDTAEASVILKRAVNAVLCNRRQAIPEQILEREYTKQIESLVKFIQNRKA